LLSGGAWNEIQKRYAGTKGARTSVEAAVRLYHYGRNYEAGRPCNWDWERQGQLLWDDPEDYLDTLDAAASGGPKKDFLWHIVEKRLHTDDGVNGPPLAVGSLQDVAADARRLVAVQCEMFTRQADTKSERWQAHAKWAKRIDEHHGIITFNYDRVLEKLGREERLPTDDPRVSDNHLFMLHGSVGWTYDRERNRVDRKREGYVADCDDADLMIATPGPSKLNTVQGYAPLWEAAMQDLAGARAIVFVGYRFPPSDAEARERLLHAIGGNQQPVVAFHVVLGPNTNHPDVVRLAALLKYTAKAHGRHPVQDDQRYGAKARLYTLDVHPLYSQDFLSLWRPTITEPRPVALIG
jgi:hypothetical protein